jgi:hypothetical protein
MYLCMKHEITNIQITIVIEQLPINMHKVNRYLDTQCIMEYKVIHSFQSQAPSFYLFTTILEHSWTTNSYVGMYENKRKGENIHLLNHKLILYDNLT